MTNTFIIPQLNVCEVRNIHRGLPYPLIRTRIIKVSPGILSLHGVRYYRATRCPSVLQRRSSSCVQGPTLFVGSLCQPSWIFSLPDQRRIFEELPHQSAELIQCKHSSMRRMWRMNGEGRVVQSAKLQPSALQKTRQIDVHAVNLRALARPVSLFQTCRRCVVQLSFRAKSVRCSP